MFGKKKWDVVVSLVLCAVVAVGALLFASGFEPVDVSEPPTPSVTHFWDNPDYDYYNPPIEEDDPPEEEPTAPPLPKGQKPYEMPEKLFMRYAVKDLILPDVGELLFTNLVGKTLYVEGSTDRYDTNLSYLFYANMSLRFDIAAKTSKAVPTTLDETEEGFDDPHVKITEPEIEMADGWTYSIRNLSTTEEVAYPGYGAWGYWEEFDPKTAKPALIRVNAKKKKAETVALLKTADVGQNMGFTKYNDTTLLLTRQTSDKTGAHVVTTFSLFSLTTKKLKTLFSLSFDLFLTEPRGNDFFPLDVAVMDGKIYIVGTSRIVQRERAQTYSLYVYDTTGQQTAVYSMEIYTDENINTFFIQGKMLTINEGLYTIEKNNLVRRLRLRENIDADSELTTGLETEQWTIWHDENKTLYVTDNATAMIKVLTLPNEYPLRTILTDEVGNICFVSTLDDVRNKFNIDTLWISAKDFAAAVAAAPNIK
ncbi:MAG: hypothetical protein LBN05_03815 [Oscillospiraceae bacterium]|jgi:hypothetical protein|nr:hypothetical protein [Oscillospiraceae bacterium]